MSWFNARVFVIFGFCAALALSACGYRPLYGQNAADPQVTQHMAAITVLPMANRNGQMMRTALKRRLAPQGQTQSLYKLDVTLNESLQQLAEQRSGFVTRANLTLTATYRLSNAQSDQLLTEGAAQTVASYNILVSDFATLSAQEDARKRAIESIADDIRTRLAIYFQGPGQARRSDGQ